METVFSSEAARSIPLFYSAQLGRLEIGHYDYFFTDKFFSE